MFYGEETGNQKYQACVLAVRYGRAGGKKQDYTSIIVKAMIGHYDREEETWLTNEELLAKIQESVRKEAEGIKKEYSPDALSHDVPLYAGNVTGDVGCGGSTAGETGRNTAE